MAKPDVTRQLLNALAISEHLTSETVALALVYPSALGYGNTSSILSALLDLSIPILATVGWSCWRGTNVLEEIKRFVDIDGDGGGFRITKLQRCKSVENLSS